MRWKVGATVGTVAIAAAAGAGAVLAGGSGSGPGQGGGPVEIRTVEAERVAVPSSSPASARADAAARKPKRGRPRVVYLETDPQTVPAGKTGFLIGRCAPRAKALNGYYFVPGQFNGFGLENEGDSPSGPRRWAFYLDAEAPSTGISGVVFGVVCMKGVR